MWCRVGERKVGGSEHFVWNARASVGVPAIAGSRVGKRGEAKIKAYLSLSLSAILALQEHYRRGRGRALKGRLIERSRDLIMT